MPQRFSLIHTHRRPDVRGEGAPPLLLALHGIGSNEQDLIGLSPHLDGRFLTVSARAPYEYGPGYSWFGLEIGPQGVIVDEEQARKSRETILQFLGEITEAYQTDPQRTYLLGFSQGSIMSYAVLAQASEKLSGVVAMSGRFSPQLLSAMKGNALLKDFPILVTHGTQDQMLPISNGRSTRDALAQLPVRLTYKEYPMGHEVSAESIRDIKAWFKERLDEK